MVQSEAESTRWLGAVVPHMDSLGTLKPVLKYMINLVGIPAYKGTLSLTPDYQNSPDPHHIIMQDIAVFSHYRISARSQACKSKQGLVSLPRFTSLLIFLYQRLSCEWRSVLTMTSLLETCWFTLHHLNASSLKAACPVMIWKHPCAKGMFWLCGLIWRFRQKLSFLLNRMSWLRTERRCFLSSPTSTWLLTVVKEQRGRFSALPQP